VTGIGIFLTPKSLLGDPLQKLVHLYASLPFILLPVIIFIFISALARKDIKELISWTDDDVRWLKEFLKNNKAQASGKFNTGQKANFLATLFIITGLSGSGFVVWMKSMFSVDFVELSFLIHDFLAILSILLLTGHLLFTLYYSESLRGIIYGTVDMEWAQEHYPNWIVRKN